jgi:D-glycero-alpha-D-manno-heptose-7-phosphate kinase
MSVDLKKMTGKVRARAPLRLGLAGGGTDVSPYSDEFGGYVLNATIDKYAYATLSNSNAIEFTAADINKHFRCDIEEFEGIPQGLELHAGVYNRIVKDFLGGSPIGVSLTTHSEAPPGSGLGSSSTMVVAMVQAFVEYLSLPLGEYDVAKLAHDIERVDLKFAGGKQDQYAATFGGFNFMEFYHDRVIVNPLRIKSNYLAELESSLVLFYTGVSRESANIIKEQTNNVVARNDDALNALHNVKLEAQKMKEAILQGNFENLAESLRSSWEAKKKMAQSISNSQIETLYNAALASGALAGKVSGAGGGGFMMFLVDPAKRPDVIRTLNNFNGQVMTAVFVEHGAHSWRVI